MTRNLLFKSLRLCLAVGLLAASAPETVAAEQVMLELNDVKDFGSGASISDDIYSPGGNPDVSLFIGNPNTSLRNDRVLLRYDLTPILFDAEKIERAEIKFTVDYFLSPEPALEVEFQCFTDPVEVLTGQELNRSDVSPAGVVVVTENDAANGRDGSVRPALEKVLDVTAVVKDDLARGLTASVFRMKIPAIEARGAHQTEGISLTAGKGKLPVLEITLKD